LSSIDASSIDSGAKVMHDSNDDHDDDADDNDGDGSIDHS
jgi:hypothetical protein